MGFVLRVTQGAGEGEEFTFEGEARLGRTADNDVVIKDPSSSRSHCRLFEKGGNYFVEDLKSANGTLLNKVALKTAKQLKHGDEIAIGDVVLEFGLLDAPEDDTGQLNEGSDTMLGAMPSSTLADSSLEDEDAPADDPNATMLKPSRALAKVPPKRAPVRRAPASEPEEDEPPPDDEPVDEEPPDDDEAPPDEDEAGSTRAFEVPPPRALARRSGVGNAAPVRASRAAAPAEMSAADRARQRRELSRTAGGRLELMWQGLSKPGRAVLSVVLAVLGLGFLGGVGYLVYPHKVQRKAEPMDLRANGEPLSDSFGNGDDVDFSRPDMKSFSFTYNSPTRVVGVLHYQSKGISKGEVTIELNGAEVGMVPADTLDSDTREQDVVLSTKAVKVGEPNTLVFDNVNNPPGDETWKIWNIWVEVNPIPEMSTEEATRRAKEDIEKASKYYDLRDVGAENLFRAWKTYRDAWLVLEATPDGPQSIQEVARTRMREIRPELDKRCAGIFVEFKKVMNQKMPDMVKARKILEDIPTYFPTREHPCNNFAHAALASLEELPEAVQK